MDLFGCFRVNSSHQWRRGRSSHGTCILKIYLLKSYLFKVLIARKLWLQVERAWHCHRAVSVAILGFIFLQYFMLDRLPFFQMFVSQNLLAALEQEVEQFICKSVLCEAICCLFYGRFLALKLRILLKLFKINSLYENLTVYLW